MKRMRFKAWPDRSETPLLQCGSNKVTNNLIECGPTIDTVNLLNADETKERTLSLNVGQTKELRQTKELPISLNQ